MSNRRIINLPKTRQRELAAQFPWLMDIELGEEPADVEILSLTVFDRWLTREEAGPALENVPEYEQARRDGLLAAFCARMVASTEVLSFVQRGRQHRDILFRRFLSKEVASEYCRPGGGRKIFGHRHFHIVLPELGCAFYESWDSTYHFFFILPDIAEAARGWASESGTHVLSHSNRRK